MHVLRCPRCKRSYQLEGLPDKYCPVCTALDEQDYQTVRDLVKENPGISIAECVEKTGIAHGRILRYIKEERLEITASSKSFLRCEACHKTIYTGQFCEECRRRFGSVAPKVIGTQKTTEEGKHISIDGVNRGY